MKKLHYILLFSVALFTASCDTDDDGFYNNVFIDQSGLVTLDTHAPTYAIGEKLYVNAAISRYLPDGIRTLDIFHTTGATQFAFTYVIEKQNGTAWDIVSVSDSQLDIVKGSAQNGSYVYGLAEYNPADENYVYRVGFPLLTAGSYRLSFGYNSDSLNSVELRSLSPKARLILNINSTLTGIDANGYYKFTVTP